MQRSGFYKPLDGIYTYIINIILKAQLQSTSTCMCLCMLRDSMLVYVSYNVDDCLVLPLKIVFHS